MIDSKSVSDGIIIRICAEIQASIACIAAAEIQGWAVLQCGGKRAPRRFGLCGPVAQGFGVSEALNRRSKAPSPLRSTSLCRRTPKPGGASGHGGQCASVLQCGDMSPLAPKPLPNRPPSHPRPRLAVFDFEDVN